MQKIGKQFCLFFFLLLLCLNAIILRTVGSHTYLILFDTIFNVILMMLMVVVMMMMRVMEINYYHCIIMKVIMTMV